MRILIISPSLDTSKNVSGISSMVRLIINNNPQHTYVHFKTGKEDTGSRGLKWIVQTLAIYPKWIGKMIKNDFDLIHFNIGLSTLSLLRDFPLVIMARLFGKKIIFHVHGGKYMYNKGSRFITSLIRCFLNRKAPVLALSIPEKEILMSHYKAGNVTVLPNCIDLSEAERFDMNEKDLSLPTILYMSRLDRAKGLQELLHAATALKKDGLRFKLFMAGAGPGETMIPLFKEALNDDYFSFLGVVSGQRKTDILKKCLIFVLPSYYEGLPMALLESMSFGLIPVITDVGSINTVVADGENGFLIKPKDTDSLYRALKKLCSRNDFPKETASAARKTIFEKFNPEVYIEKLNEVYRMCM